MAYKRVGVYEPWTPLKIMKTSLPAHPPSRDVATVAKIYRNLRKIKVGMTYHPIWEFIVKIFEVSSVKTRSYTISWVKNGSDFDSPLLAVMKNIRSVYVF